MFPITTNFGTFLTGDDELNNNCTKVIHPLSGRLIIILHNVYWWDRDGIEAALYKNKELIIEKLRE